MRFPIEAKEKEAFSDVLFVEMECVTSASGGKISARKGL
ncbi:hypothetical protein C900_05525 [Fulvivirga imtechensis AK7]|uniref:Uncharacterized protein n=1 Tax=Fulvivirga imtechensis AK7 TaxID=1237149 RepID=L8JJQ9_9BACT|nr:hypothetical protein C900_05525 [Fulvivirga imtechensis AK7]